MSTYKNIRYNAAIQAGVTGTAISYANAASLPLSGLSIGELALTDANALYITNGSGWYKIATTNETPSVTLSVDTVNTEPGSNTVSATYTVTEPEGTPTTDAVITYDFTSNANIVHYTGNTTLAITNQNTGTYSGDIIISVSDGVNIGVATLTLINTVVGIVAESRDTSLLAKASGNAGTNTTFTDGSTNSHTVTVSGDAHSTALTPYHSGGYSTYLDGSGDYLQVASSSDFAFGTGDFTMEFWHYPETIATSSVIDYRTGANGNQAVPIIWIHDNGYYYYYVNGSNRIVGSSGSIVANQWYHVAISRVSGSTKMFVNGQQVGNTYNDSSISYLQGGPFVIGRRYTNAGTGFYYLDGYLRDVRVLKGTGLYSAAFTAPTEPLTAITNTKLLTCHLPYIADGSTNDYAVTLYGNTKTERFGPYDYNTYSASNDGTSVSFDGTGDYLRTSDDATLEWGSSDFTLEFWYKGNDTDQYATLVSRTPSGFGSGCWSLMMNHTATGDVTLYHGNYSTGAPMLRTTSGSVVDNSWHHIALVRNSNDWALYVDGVSKATITSDTDLADIAGGWTIGADQNYGRNLSGNISDLRYVKGTAVYTSTFTPPTEPLTAITNTELLVQSSLNIFDASGSNGLTLAGTTQSSTTQTKHASSSIYLDGNSDYVSIEADDRLDMETEDFTIEAWVYPVATSNIYPSFISSVTGWSSGASSHRFDNTGQAGKFTFHFNPGDPFLASTNTFNHDEWHHYVITRSANLYQMYVNGNLEASVASTVTYNPALGGMKIGQSTWDGASGYFSGYVSDIRISKGLSRYPFIPASETLTAITNTELLALYTNTVTDEGSSDSLTISQAGASDVAVSSSHRPFAEGFSYYFNGSNMYLNLANFGGWGTGDYTYECFVKIDDTTSRKYVFGPGTDTASHYKGIGLEIYGNKIAVWESSNGTGWDIRSSDSTGNRSDSTLTTGKWYHVAVCREGDVRTLFVNGKKDKTYTSTSNPYHDTSQYNIGRSRYTGSFGPFNGYISNLRFVVGTALYSGDFTPPTSELKG